MGLAVEVKMCFEIFPVERALHLGAMFYTKCATFRPNARRLSMTYEESHLVSHAFLRPRVLYQLFPGK